jgi:tRNA-specific 2-thiouridylase
MRVFVAMSGGVDSSVAAALLVRAGNDVTGVTMRLLPGQDEIDGCCSLDGVRSAKRVCDALDIPHYTMEFSDVFEREVIAPYCDEYAAGRTPNPCIACNDRVKFSELLRRVSLQGADVLATGHYARIEADAEGHVWLARGVDATKDQSYFLYRLTETQLRHVMFPLGELTKDEVRRIAAELGLPSAERPESQETCFVPGDDVRAFVRERRPEAFRGGDILEADGTVVGTHDGVPGFTIGQRKGLGVGAAERRYVTSVDPAAATLTLGSREDLRVRTVSAAEAVWREDAPDARVTCRLRYRGPETPATARMADGELIVRFEEDVETPAPGQALVCYDSDRVIGGGVIRGAS